MSQPRLFISKSLDELSELPEYCRQHSLHLTGYSFLRFEACEFDTGIFYDVLFFASPRAARYFLLRTPPRAGSLIACAGMRTAAFVQQAGYVVDYVAEKSGDPHHSAQKFARWVGRGTVLFPGSSISRGSYARFLPEHQARQLTVYTTHVTPAPVEVADYYVFTSPSNVQGFTGVSQQLPARAHIIAWGETTADSLRNAGISVDHTLTVADESTLIAYLSATMHTNDGSDSPSF